MVHAQAARIAAHARTWAMATALQVIAASQDLAVAAIVVLTAAAPPEESWVTLVSQVSAPPVTENFHPAV